MFFSSSWDENIINIYGLDLSSDPTMTKLSDELSKKPTATSLWLQSNNITDANMPKVVELLKIYTTIEKVYLCQNNIGDEGVKLIASLISTTNHLMILDLSYNNIGNKGGKLLSDALKHNKSLTAIHLTGNKIENKGAKYIFDALKENINTTLKVLSIGYNCMDCTADVIESICGCLRENQTLYAISITGYTMDDHTVNIINDAFYLNRSIGSLNFYKKNMTTSVICERNLHNLEQRAKRLVDL
jgi:Ran GTPase-activating protein (RanGAP) involved in mRNA processing and transport